MPASARKQYFALRAFNVELASIKDGSERRKSRPMDDIGPSLGHRMRMQWWREALEELYAGDESLQSPRAAVEPSVEGFVSSISTGYWLNPIVRALHHAVEESNLTRRFLERLLDAREADLEIQQLPTMDNAIMYAEDSSSSLFYLSLECCNVREDKADEVASHIGVGCGLVTAIRSAPFRAVTDEMSIPAELLTRPIPSGYLSARRDPDYKANSDNERALQEAVQHMAYVASRSLSRARDAQMDVPKEGRPALLLAVPAIHYLSKLKEVKYDLFDERLQPEHGKLVMLSMLARAWFTGKL
jgi:NADH dehydrogenase [ubiquinone] 1 alpha subcomplex assembly factor 6